MEPELVVTVTDSVGLLELNRPAMLNSLTESMVAGLGPAAEDAVAQGARALVIAGRGGAFCAGADLALVDRALAGEPRAALTPLVVGLHGSLGRLRAVPVPIVAAVEGPAVGAGLGIALAADLRIVASRARLIPGYLAIGSSPDGGVSYTLTRMVGAARAMSIILSNRTLTAADATELGLAEEEVPEGTAVEHARDLAARLSTTAPLALLRLRELLDAAPTHGFQRHLELEQQRVSELWDTHDFAEGVRAFGERRPPEFRGD